MKTFAFFTSVSSLSSTGKDHKTEFMGNHSFTHTHTHWCRTEREYKNCIYIILITLFDYASADDWENKQQMTNKSEQSDEKIEDGSHTHRHGINKTFITPTNRS